MGVLITFAAIAISVGVGVWSERRWPEGAANAARKALLLVLYALLPPVIFFNLAKAEIDASHAVGLALGLVAVALSSLLAYWVASRVMRLSRPQTGAVVCAVLSVNTGYLGYPLTVALLGRGELSHAVLYDVLVSGPSLLLGAFAVGAAVGTKAGDTKGDQRLLALVARLAVVPVLLMLLAAPLIDLPTTYRLMSAMPTGLNSMVVSHAYGLDNRITAEAIAWSTAIVVLAALGSLLL